MNVGSSGCVTGKFSGGKAGSLVVAVLDVIYLAAPFIKFDAGSDREVIREESILIDVRSVLNGRYSEESSNDFKKLSSSDILLNGNVNVIEMDAIDKRILAELQAAARMSYAQLGRKVGLTTPAVIERVRKLEDAGIITGYRAEVDASKVGFPITAFVRMSITGVDYSHIIEVAQNSSEVLECHRGTGGDSFIMKLAVSSVEHLQEVIDRLTPYGITTTTIVLSSPVKRKAIEL